MNLTHDAIALPGYQIIEQLYIGSRTLVYRAIRLVDQVPVVIKLLRNEYPSFSELVQFRNQYTLAKNLNLPGIIQIYSLDAHRNGYALVMEDFGGVSLQQFVHERSLSLEAFCAIALQLCDTLHHLHQQSIIHKDIKPANILIHPETRQIKLIDFSISSLLPRESQEIKNPGGLEGTLAYLAPEQTGRMNRGIDYRADFYSLGVVFYEILTGQLPFLSNDPMELVHCHIAKQPPSVCDRDPDMPLMLGEIIHKLMAKNAEDRYQSALGLKHDLMMGWELWQTSRKNDRFELGQRDVSDRFLIPEKLYGREAEVEALLAAFGRVANGASELMLVAGFSGIGKTAVINEVHKPIVRWNGYFIKGKYDQFNRNVPLSAFVQAFRDLMGQLLSESDAELQTWKSQILHALGENGQVMIDVIPELAYILGTQPPAPELSGAAAQNRFNRLFQKFISVFATAEHPLVMFLDDLQWADLASLDLMKLLMTEAEQGYLLLMGAYRDNEVFPAHPLMLALDDIQKASATVNTLILAPLTQATINQIIADTLSCPQDIALPLTELVYQKTKGNPFFTTQFLKALYDDQLITLDREAGSWQCDVSQVRMLALTEDVVEFMALQLQKLPAPTQTALKLAACIGNQFDLATLAIAAEKSPAETALDLWKALQEGFVIATNQVYKFYQAEHAAATTAHSAFNTPTCSYRFLHDRIQQAAYSLIAKSDKQITHLKIGQRLLRDSSTKEREERLFEIVNHLNVGTELITQCQEREMLAELNLAAGRKAKASTAYGAAIAYLTTGIALLPETAWDSHYALMLALHEEVAEASYLNTDFAQMEAWADIVLQHTKTLLDAINVQQTRILGAKAQGQFLNSIQIGLQVLQTLGIEFPEHPTQEDIGQAFGITRSLWADKDPLSLLDLPPLQDPQLLAAMEILTSLVAAAYVAAPALMPLLIFKQVELSIPFGNCPVSIFSYADYGLILCGVIGDIENGHAFGELALRLLDHFQLTPSKCRSWYVVYQFIKHWKSPLASTLSPLQEAYRSGLETGDIETACLSAVGYCYYAYYAGQELTELAQAMATYGQSIDQCQITAALFSQKLYHQTVLNLLGQSDVPYQLTGRVFNQEEALPKLYEINQQSSLFAWHLNQMTLYYLFEQHEAAVQTAAQTVQYLSGSVALFMMPLYAFFDALIQLTQYPTGTEADRQSILDTVRQHQEKLQIWAGFAPENHQHRWELVAAEECRVLGNRAEAMELYDRAIAHAQENGFIQDAALANELAAKFYLNWGKEKIAAVYLQEAYYDYARWGAKAKLADLETRYPPLLAPILQQPRAALSIAETVFTASTVASTSSSSRSVSDSFDLAAILEASQTLSSEIELDKLLATVLTIVIENAGADSGALMLWQGDRLLIQGTGAIATPPVVLQNLPVETSPDLPLKLIYKVQRSQEMVVLADATTDPTLIADPYIVRQQPKSVLCSPILHQGKMLGLLYLENRLAMGAFTRDRVEILNILCAQAAISLENARLYQQAQQALADSQLKQFSIDCSALAVYWIESDARIAYVNDAACRDLGYTRAEIVGTSIYDFDPDFPQDYWDQHWQDLREQKTMTFESQHRHKNGTLYPVEITANYFIFNGKEYNCGFVLNISDRKQAEQAVQQKSQALEQALLDLQQAQLQMIQSEKMSALGNLVTGVAHEINNPVGFIAGNLQPAMDYIQDTFGLLDLYQQEYPQPSAIIQNEITAIDLDYIREDLPKLIGSMNLGVDRIRSISTSLRTFSRADKDYKVPFNIHDGIDSTILILKHRIKANENRSAIEVMTHYGDIPIIECFPGQLNQVFMNILANAIDALEETIENRRIEEAKHYQGQIHIKTQLDDSQEHVVIKIQDNGMGMPDEVKQKAFDHLFTTKAVGKGTGLGLAIAHQIVVEKHGGAIAVNSALTQGTEFTIQLPIYGFAANAPALPSDRAILK